MTALGGNMRKAYWIVAAGTAVVLSLSPSAIGRGIPGLILLTAGAGHIIFWMVANASILKAAKPQMEEIRARNTARSKSRRY